jgi:hypothetical protein
VRRGPRPRAAVPLENQTTVAVADVLQVACTPGWLWTHFPAGEHRHPIVGARLQRMGLQRGWPDFVLLSPKVVPHFLELKRGDMGQLSAEQEDFRDWCLKRRARWALARSVDEAIEQLQVWGAISRLAVSA